MEMADTTDSSKLSIFATAKQDLMTLTKARLSALVVVTTVFGYLVGAKMLSTFSWSILLHTTFGTVLAAFGAAVFNQLMEIDVDAKMNRTADRPLPANRIPRSAAFGIGVILCAFGMVHLSIKANPTASFFRGGQRFSLTCSSTRR